MEANYFDFQNLSTHRSSSKSGRTDKPWCGRPLGQKKFENWLMNSSTIPFTSPSVPQNLPPITISYRCWKLLFKWLLKFNHWICSIGKLINQQTVGLSHSSSVRVTNRFSWVCPIFAISMSDHGCMPRTRKGLETRQTHAGNYAGTGEQNPDFLRDEASGM